MNVESLLRLKIEIMLATLKTENLILTSCLGMDKLGIIFSRTLIDFIQKHYKGYLLVAPSNFYLNLHIFYNKCIYLVATFCLPSWIVQGIQHY